jgi:hypothetical protein
MPEANVLYTVTAVVVAGLVVWVLAALKMAKEPWARPEAAAAAAAAALEKNRAPDVPIEKVDEKVAGETETPAEATKDEEAEKKEEA